MTMVLVPELTQKVLESMYTALVIIDAAEKIVYLNNAAERILEISRDDVAGRQLSDMLLCSRLQEVVKTGEGYINEKVKVDEDKYILSSGAPIKKDGKIIGAFAVFNDYKELRERLRAVEAANKELNAIIESSYDGIWISDGQGVTLRVNKTYEEFSGIKASEVVGRSLHDLVKEGYYSDSAALHVMEKKEPVTLVHEIKTGKKAMVTANPVFDAEGNIWRIITNVRDITLMSRLQEQLEQMKSLSRRYELELEELRRKSLDRDVICNSRSMELTLDLATRVAKVDSTVLILGESGVGKGLIARLIHKNSKRRDKPFIKVNCGAIPESLMESELFGYEKGSFTGAGKDGKPGIFELAQKGTLFLDEIGEMPLHLQVKLLQAVQEQQYYRVGGTVPIKLDVRILAATNKDLLEMMEKGEFRKDLYYRLNVVSITIPPLNKRKEDIPLLVNHFIDKFSKKFGVRKQVSPPVVDALIAYDWPGNVRELENVVERLVVLSSDEIITVDDLPANIGCRQKREDDGYVVTIPGGSSLRDALEHVEKHLITESLIKYGSTRRVADMLDVNQSTVVRKVQKYNIYSKIRGAGELAQ
ncbi:MAG: sigma 54-interacting transcriptional regulator [Bacillota bacterium]